MVNSLLEFFFVNGTTPMIDFFFCFNARCLFGLCFFLCPYFRRVVAISFSLLPFVVITYGIGCRYLKRMSIQDQNQNHFTTLSTFFVCFRHLPINHYLAWKHFQPFRHNSPCPFCLLLIRCFLCIFRFLLLALPRKKMTADFSC